MFTRQNNVSLRKMILLVAVTVGTAALTGCQTNPYSKVENEVYGYVNKFSKKIPKGFVRSESPEDGDNIAYHDPKLGLGNEFGGSGRIVLAMYYNGFKGLASGYADFDEMKPWIDGEAEDKSKLKPGSLIYFGFVSFVSVQTYPVSGQAVALIKDEEAVTYVKLANEWQRLEMQFAARNWSESLFAWFQHVKDKAGETVPKEHVQRYIKLANTLSKTYLNKEIEQ